MDLRSWIMADHASTAARFGQAIVPHVPIELWKERADCGGASIAWLLFHFSYHHDLAVNSVVRGQPPLLTDQRGALGLAGVETQDGLGEAEQPDVTAALALEELADYAAAVQRATSDYLGAVELARLDDEVRLDGLAELAGVRRSDVPWLYGMWAGKTAGWMVQWEAIGHVHGHVAEMISVRGRLGLSPF